MAPAAMFPQKDPLPGSQCQVAVADGYQETRPGQDSANVGGHIIRPLIVMGITGVTIWHLANEIALQILKHAGISVFGDEQGGTGVLAEYLAEAGLQTRVPHEGCHPTTDVKWTATAGGEGQAGLMEVHDSHWQVAELTISPHPTRQGQVPPLGLTQTHAMAPPALTV